MRSQEACSGASLGISGNRLKCRVVVVDVVKVFTEGLVNIRGHAVAQLVEALRYKSEGRGFDSRCCHWIFSLT